MIIRIIHGQYSQNNCWSVNHTDLNADKKRMWIPSIGIKSIDTKKMNVSIPFTFPLDDPTKI